MLNFDFNEVANKIALCDHLVSMVDDLLYKHEIWIRPDANIAGSFNVSTTSNFYDYERFPHIVFAYKYALDKLEEKLNAKSKSDPPNP